MNAQYNNNGYAGRYVCGAMKSSYGDPFCQSLTAAPLDALVADLVLQALAPAALEASLALTADLAAERAALDQQWQQRVERGRYQADRARRQYAAVEPENRLVARTLEQDWEAALAEQTRLEAEYERFRSAQAAAPSAAELAAIQALAQDVPALWQAETTTREERQTIVRLLLERVLVTVVDGSEQVRVECHWQGGQRTAHALTRPVARLKALSTYADLVARASALHRDGQDCVAIAATLNREGWRPAKRRTTFNASMVRHLPLGADVIQPRYHRRKPQIDRRPDEWTIRELAAEIGMPEPTLYTWVQRGRLRSRLVRTGPGMTKLVYADSETIAALRAARAIPAPWHRLPPPLLPQPHH